MLIVECCVNVSIVVIVMFFVFLIFRKDSEAGEVCVFILKRRKLSFGVSSGRWRWFF